APRPAGNASAIYSPTRASLTALSHLESNFIASAKKNNSGSLSPMGEGRGEGIRPHLSPKFDPVTQFS
ncbi:hypothetical protein, partial [Enterobacter hormaechei]|uniref:hypothetical protein n=1 Tax=Enterobacter hormaechei TaxID=158836 RepID=UPI001E3038FE